ncbi:MAG: polyphosphate:AMP phosphotransferase [Clostridium sp.]
MLENVDLSKKMKKKDYDLIKEEYEVKLGSLQREAKKLGIPIIILFEGWGASGKGTLINKLIHPLDPRGFNVYSTKVSTSEEKYYPFLHRFWIRTPSKGNMVIFDRGWYRQVLLDRLDKVSKRNELSTCYEEINSFEEELFKDGTLIFKFFLHITKEEQKKRFEALESSNETKWRVTKEDWKHYEQYDEYLKIIEETLVKTDNDYCRWHIIEAMDKEYAMDKVFKIVIKGMEERIAFEKSKKEFKKTSKVNKLNLNESTILDKIDLLKKLEKEEYKERLDKAQKKLSKLQNQLYLKRIPVVIAFEGWDAAGKGGAIKRITEKMDPRGYNVNPIAAPNDIEKEHHYLWRFWTKIPKGGHIGIFDRTWYGRVLVERVENLATENEWKRAYKEMNDMEFHLYNEGTIIIKFWIHIDKEEQAKRFKEREENPEKQWKITSEDWRNREKWDEYLQAINEMLIRTSTNYAPWTIVEGNSKYYARVKVIETIVKVLEEKLNKGEKK